MRLFETKRRESSSLRFFEIFVRRSFFRNYPETRGDKRRTRPLRDIYIYMYNIFWLAIHGYSVSSYERRKPLEAFYLLISLITIK